MYHFWITNPYLHTRSCTLILTSICNVLGILNLRLLATHNGIGRRTATSLTASLEPQWKELLTRPSRPLHGKRSPDLFTFIRMQILGATGGLPLENHMVYMMMASQNPTLAELVQKDVLHTPLPRGSPRGGLNTSGN